MANSDFDAVAKELYGALNTKANAALGKTNNVTLEPINLGSAGYFPWFYENANNNFNQNTFLFLNRTISHDGNGALKLGDPFDGDYARVMEDISFSLSSADKTTLDKANTQAQLSMASVVNGYQTTYGAITPAQMTTAKVDTKIDYIISYKMGQIWSDKGNTKPLTWSEMLNARNLSSLLPNLPASANPLLNNVAKYLSDVSGVISLIDAVSNGNWLCSHLKTNTTTPGDTNGGMTTVENDGTIDMEVGFSINQSEDALNKSLGNTDNKFEINMDISQSNSSTLIVNVEGHGGVSVPIGFMELSVQGGASFNLSSIKGSSKQLSIKASFPGLTFVSFTPEQFQQATGKGWYLTQVIKEAIQNGAKDVTGYKFTTVPSYDFSKNGNFGLLNALAICQFPTITINYSQGDYSQFQQSFKEKSKWELKMLGLCPIGGGGQDVCEATSSANSSGGGFSITFAPPANNYVDPSGVANNNQAFVLGGQVTYPGA